MSTISQVVIVRDGTWLDGAQVRAQITHDGWALVKLGTEETLLLPNEWELLNRGNYRRELENRIRAASRAPVHRTKIVGSDGNRQRPPSKRVLGPRAHD